MQKNKSNGSEKILALTLILINILLLVIAGGTIWLVKMLISLNDQFSQATGNFGLM